MMGLDVLGEVLREVCRDMWWIANAEHIFVRGKNGQLGKRRIPIGGVCGCRTCNYWRLIEPHVAQFLV